MRFLPLPGPYRHLIQAADSDSDKSRAIALSLHASDNIIWLLPSRTLLGSGASSLPCLKLPGTVVRLPGQGVDRDTTRNLKATTPGPSEFNSENSSPTIML